MHPWTDHVRPLAELGEAAIRDAIDFDRHLYRLAQERPYAAARECVESRLHYRTGPPRLGEPVYPDPMAAERDWQSMNCGRGTGHFGTGLYFFGTLSAAAVAPRHARDGLGVKMLREMLRRVWVVDVSAIPADTVYHPGDRERVWELHRFAKAMICYPGALEDLREAQAQVEDAERRDDELTGAIEELLEGPDDSPTPAEFDELWEERFWLREGMKGLRDTVHRAHADLRREFHRIEFDAPKFEGASGTWDSVELPPRAQAAVDEYTADVQERRFPGYHPMTYYMRSLGYGAIIHRIWDQLISGDIGNIWYPDV